MKSVAEKAGASVEKPLAGKFCLSSKGKIYHVGGFFCLQKKRSKKIKFIFFFLQKSCRNDMYNEATIKRKGGNKLTASERRRAILELLCVRKFETTANLAAEFGVSVRTIGYDIERLSLDYPIYTTTGTYGGVRIMEGFRLRKKFLSEEQTDFLKELIPTLSGDKKTMAESILNDFSVPVKKDKKHR